MPPKKKAGDKKKKPKKPSSFAQFWNRLLRRDKKKGLASDGVPTEKTVQRAVDKVAKALHMKSQEREQVTNVLAAELQQRALEKEQAHQRSVARKGTQDGVASFPVVVQTGLFEQPEGEGTTSADISPGPDAEQPAEPAVVALQQPLPKMAGSDLDMQRRSFLMRSGGGSGKSGSSGRGGSYTAQSFGSQPESITLDQSAVTEIKKHMLINMLREVLVDASVRQQPAKGNQKRPEDMNADELIQLRKTNPREWEALVKENTVVSYALSKPNEQEVKKGQQVKEQGVPKRKALHFDDNVEVANAPVGQDFCPDEKKKTSKEALRK